MGWILNEVIILILSNYRSIEVEKLDMPALRILRHIFSKEIALQIIDYDGVYRLMRVIKR